jgi:CRP-like cAMP-binding protein
MSAGRTEIELPPHVLEYLEQQSTVTLATASSSGVPRAATLLYVNRGPLLYMWVRPKTTTARHVEQNSLVSFAIDEYSEDWRQTKAGEKSAEEFGVDFHSDEVLNVISDLPHQESANIEAPLQTVSASEGEVIARQDGPADKFFIVVDGEVELVREGDGTEERLGSYGPGHLFGEMSVMRDSPRSATLRATKASTLLTLERDDFRDLVAEALGTTGDFDQVIQRRLESLSG